MAEIALYLTPRVCMAGQTLIEQDQVSSILYVTMHMHMTSCMHMHVTR